MVVLVSALVNALVLAWMARRLIGAPVGWPRTIVLSIVVGLVASPSSQVLGFFATLFELPQSAAEVSGLPSAHQIGYALVLGLFAAWVVASEVAVLTLLEVFIPTGTLPSPLQWVRDLPGRLRRNRRYAQIFRIAAKHGLAGFLRSGSTARASRVSGTNVPAQVAGALIDGGVTFVKLGQTLATRADLLPPAYIAELSTLHSEVPASPWAIVKDQIEAELGRPIEQVFAQVEPEPLAAASVAQVHRATLPTGEAVVVKVQRPLARAQATADLDIVQRLGHWAQTKTDWGRRIGTQDLANGFATALAEELDYRIEIANMQVIAQAATGTVQVPTVWPALCTPRMIVMAEVPGAPLSRSAAQVAQLPPRTRQQLAGDLFDSVLAQVMTTGVFHADLHPGNIVFEPGDDTAKPQLTLLDFGSVGRLDRSSREALGLFLLAFERQDGTVATDALLELLGRPEGGDDQGLEREIGELILAGGDSSDHFTRLLNLVLRRGFSVPPMVAAAFRAIATLEGSLKGIDPNFDLMRAARARTRSMVSEQLSVAQATDRLQFQLATTLPLLQRLPRRVDQILRGIESGEIAAGMRPLGTAGDRTFAQGLFREATGALIAATLTLAGVALIISDGGPRLIGVIGTHAWLGATFLLFGFILGARQLVLGFGSR